MSEELKPEVVGTPDVAQETPQTVTETVVNYGEKTLAELSALFEELAASADRLRRPKEAEAIKSAFYKKLSKEKAEAGFGTVEEPTEDAPEAEAAAPETGTPTDAAPAETGDAAPAETGEAAEAGEAPVEDNPFAAIEAGFKALYTTYKKERAEYNRQLEGEREDNLAKKQAVIEDLKALVEKQEDVGATFPAFREIQARWREIGPVPIQDFRDINDTYQFYVEKFYDMVKINRDLRDLDFKKNLEAKEQFCAQAEKLADVPNVVEAFRELQKLHEQWKEYGPVAKEFRESIWDRFRAATAVINKKYQAYFEGLKEQQADNLVKKTALCERVEAIADQEIVSSNEWNTLSKAIEDIQAEWRKIGFASKKENQKIYDRFRAACDKFFGRKREFYAQFKDSMNDNMDRKLAIIAEAEALKDSTDWKKTTEAFIDLQKRWKEIGAVPRKRSEQLWKRFRAACDAFFDERDKHTRPDGDYAANLAKKQAVIDEIRAYDGAPDTAAAEAFAARWQAIGFVPFKEKEAVVEAYRNAMAEKFPGFSTRAAGRTNGRPQGARPRSERDRLVQQYNQLQQDINTYENNIGFFASSKNSEPLIRQMEEKIASAKEELKTLEQQIRALQAAEAAANE